MKTRVTLAIVILAAAIVGCKDNTVVKTETRAVGAAEALKTDEKAIAARFAEQKSATDAAFQKQSAIEGRQRRVDVLLAMAARWESTLGESYSKPRNFLATHVDKLKTIVAETEATDVDDCTGGARAKLTGAMATSLEGINMFLNSSGDETEAGRKKGQEGVDALAAANAAIRACTRS